MATDAISQDLQAIGMYQADVLADISFLVIDIHPEGAAGTALRALGEWLSNYRYVPFSGYRCTAVRDLVFRKADADSACAPSAPPMLPVTRPAPTSVRR